MVLNVKKTGLLFPKDKTTWQSFDSCVGKHIQNLMEQNSEIKALYLCEKEHSVSSRTLRKIFSLLEKLKLNTEEKTKFITILECSECEGVDVAVYVPFFCWDIGGSLHHGYNREEDVNYYYMSPVCASCLNRFENDGDKECPLHGGAGCWCGERMSAEVVLGRNISN